MLSDLKNIHASYDSKLDSLTQKMVSLEDQSCDFELDALRQKQELANREMIDHLSHTENDVISHVETIKGNMEKELSGAKHNQILLGNKLADITADIDLQNGNMNTKIQELRNDFEQLKTLSDNFSSPSQSEASYGAGTFSMNSVGSNSSQETLYSSCDPDNYLRQPEDPETLYMYGDTTKTLIIDGINEDHYESLEEIIVQCANEIGVPLALTDIVDAYRIGKSNPSRKWPRPVKVTLSDQTKRDQIFIFKARLRFLEIYRVVRIHKEERKDIRIKVAKLRQAAQAAKRLGYQVEFKQDEILIDGVHYTTLTLDSIPQIFMKEANEIKYPPKNRRRLSLSDKCTRKAEKIIMVGPSLQKTKLGLAFLSNFYPCEIYFRGQLYTSLEQAYQGTKAKVYKDDAAFEAILKASTQTRIKGIGGQIVVDRYWDELKLQIMHDLVLSEFKQNKKLYYSLLKVTHNPSQSVRPQIFKIKLSIWVYSIWFTDDKVKV